MIFLIFLLVSCITLQSAETITLTMQQENIDGALVGSPFNVTAEIQKNGKEVTLTIPGLNLAFAPTMLTPPVPPSFPSGGYVDTIDHFLPKKFRHHYPLPVSFFIESNGNDPFYVGEVDFRGKLRILGPQSLPVNAGRFASMPATVTYEIKKAPKVTVKNFIIWDGFSNAAKWNPFDFPDGQEIAISFDFGDYDDISHGFHDNKLYAIWADNSAELPFNTPDQAFKSYALAKIDVKNKKVKVHKPINLTRVPCPVSPLCGISTCDTLITDTTYAEGSVAIDLNNPNNIAVIVMAQGPFILAQSCDGGETWTHKILTISDSSKPPQGFDVHVRWDKYGGLWICYLETELQLSLVYSSDKGESFDKIFTFKGRLKRAGDFPWIDIGPDPQDPSRELIWLGFHVITNLMTANAVDFFVKPVIINGLGKTNIEVPKKAFHLKPELNFANLPLLAVGPKGEVVIAMEDQSFPDAPRPVSEDRISLSNSRNYIVINTGGINGEFSPIKVASSLSAGASSLDFIHPPPAQPHRALTNLSGLVIDKSTKHLGRIYIGYVDVLGSPFSLATKPFLIWSDDQGITWSSPLLVADNPKSQLNQIQVTLAVDDVTGKVAMTWYDARNDPTQTGQNVQQFGVILNPDQLLSP